MNKWINVNDEFPKTDKRVLIYIPIWKINGCAVYIATFCNRDKENITHWHVDSNVGDSGFCKRFKIEEVTHWMPIPEPPKENNNE